MSATKRWQRVPSGVCAGSARLPERNQSHPWAAVWALAGIVLLSLSGSPCRVVAAESGSNQTLLPGREAIQLPEGSRYVPQVVGLKRYRLGRGTGAVPRIPVAEDCPACDSLGVYEPSHFNKSTIIDNEWLPLKPGTQLILQGVANRGGGVLPHLVIFTVTDLLKRINGIPCVVIWDQDINEGVLRESELAFFAQSDEGDVWNSGEYPEEYDNGEFVSAENTWIHGIEGAAAGVTVQKNPILGAPGYREAIALENDFWDCGLVYSLSEEERGRHRGSDRMGDGHKDRDEDRDRDRDRDRDKDKDKDRHRNRDRDTLVIKEWAPLDGCDVIQLKTYAEDIGVVQVGALDDPEGETLTLVAVRKLDSAGLDSARTAALALDAHGYEVNWIYSQTEPAYRAPRRGDPDDDDDEADDLRASQVLAETPVAPSRTFISAAPNPIITSTSIAYGIAQEGPVEFGIFDVTGRVVRSLVNQTVAPGVYRVQWDGSDDRGNGVARGVYFARLRTGAQVVQKTLVVQR